MPQDFLRDLPIPPGPPIGGVCLIRLSSTHYYGGRAVDLRKRFREHWHGLKNGTHKNQHMQNVFNLHGKFECSVLKLLQGDAELKAFEQQWLDVNVGLLGCLNKSPSAEGPMQGRKHTAATRAKMSASYKGPSEGTLQSNQRRAAARVGLKLSDSHRLALVASWERRRSAGTACWNRNLPCNEALGQNPCERP